MQLPRWLPPPISEHAKRLLDGRGLDDESVRRLNRLCRDLEMKKVWAALCKAAPSQTILLEFLDFSLREARFLPDPQKPSISQANLRRSFERTAKLATLLLRELQKIDHGEETSNPGIEELRAALKRIALSPHAAAARFKKETAAKITSTALALHQLLADNFSQVSVSDCLEDLAAAAALAAAAPPSSAPRKATAENVARTHYIRAVDDFLRYEFRRSMPSAVAAIVNVCLDLGDEQVSESLVRSLRPLDSKSPVRRIARKFCT